jgi:predicted restriction endonuclease
MREVSLGDLIFSFVNTRIAAIGIARSYCWECPRITGVDNPNHLLASHSKPWRDSSNEERLNGENGLLLTPSIDHLFDRGFIGFEDSGTLIISPVAHKPSLRRMGVETERTISVGGFTEGQRQFLEFHRNAVLLRVTR